MKLSLRCFFAKKILKVTANYIPDEMWLCCGTDKIRATIFPNVIHFFLKCVPRSQNQPGKSRMFIILISKACRGGCANTKKCSILSNTSAFF